MRALVVLAVLIGCRQSQPEARRVSPPTAEEAEAFGRAFATHMMPCSATELDARIDQDLLLARSFANRRLSDGEIKGFKRGFQGVGTLFCRQLDAQTNVDARYLRVVTIGGTPRPLIRLIMDGALNYAELELDKRGGQVKLVDLTIYMSGEPMSASIGKLIDLLIDSDTTVTLAMKRVNTHVATQEWKEAHEAFKALPANIRTSKPLRLVEIQILSGMEDDAAYLAAMDSFAKAFPNDPALALIQIDRTILKKQYDESLRVLEALDKQVGGDPYLDVFRADVIAAQGKKTEALEVATRASKQVPELVATWWSLLTQQAANARYADAIVTLEKLRDQFGQNITSDALAADDRFKGLVESPEYDAWTRR